MKDAKGHGSNTRGAVSKGMLVKGRALKDDAHRVAMKVLDKVGGTGAHTGGIDKLPALQRRHYEAIAAELKAQGVGKNSDEHAGHVADVAAHLSTTNPNFDRVRFIKAATP